MILGTEWRPNSCTRRSLSCVSRVIVSCSLWLSADSGATMARRLGGTTTDTTSSAMPVVAAETSARAASATGRLTSRLLW